MIIGPTSNSAIMIGELWNLSDIHVARMKRSSIGDLHKDKGDHRPDE